MSSAAWPPHAAQISYSELNIEQKKKNPHICYILRYKRRSSSSSSRGIALLHGLGSSCAQVGSGTRYEKPRTTTAGLWGLLLGNGGSWGKRANSEENTLCRDGLCKKKKKKSQVIQKAYRGKQSPGFSGCWREDSF